MIWVGWIRNWVQNDAFPVQGLIDRLKNKQLKFVDEGFGTEWLEFGGQVADLLLWASVSSSVKEKGHEADGSSDFSLTPSNYPSLKI